MTAIASFIPQTGAETLWVIRDKVSIQSGIAGADLLLAEVAVGPGGGTPLHSHASPETMRMLTGEVVFMTMENGETREFVARPGDVFSVPANAPHGYQNRSGAPATFLAIFDESLHRFLRDAGTAEQRHGPPTPPEIDRVFGAARAHGMTLFV
jgi:quercetin dioxygenase-like cupin family protein